MIKYLIGATLLVGAVYGLFEAWPLIAGPSLSVLSPVNNATIEGGIVTVEGTSKRVARLTLNGATLLYDQNGAFSSILTFPAGGSILTFEASDRFGRKVTLTRSLYVPPFSD